MKRRKPPRELRVELCDRCADICDDRCRAETLRQRNLDRARLLGVRL